MQGGASGDEDGAIPQSIPAQMGAEARKAAESAQAEAQQSLAGLMEKTNGIIDKAQDALDGFVKGAYDGKQKVVTGIDTAIGAIETPLLAVAPALREIASTGINTVFGVAEGIPQTVQDQIKSIKDPLIEQVTTQVDSMAEAAVNAVQSVETQLDGIKDELLGMADEQLDGLADRIKDAMAAIPAQLDGVIEQIGAKFAEAYEGQPLYDEIKIELDELLNGLKESAARLIDTVIGGATDRLVAVKDDAIKAIDDTFDELFAALKSLPNQVSDTVKGIVTAVDTAVEETLTQAKQLAEDLLEDLKTRLTDAANLVSDTVKKIIEDGFTLLCFFIDKVFN